MNGKLIIYAAPGADIRKAEKLAGHLDIPVTGDRSEAEGFPAFIMVDETGLSLCGNGQAVRPYPGKILPRLRKNNLFSELLVKAANPKKLGSSPTAIDATAGFGEDSMLLAAAGFKVTLYEYDPVIAALLADALDRAKQTPGLEDVVSRMELIEGDSIIAMRQTTSPPDVILLDPMFPERRKSALVKKKFQLLHVLESPCSDEKELLEAALEAHPKKIIIKRPLKGGYLAGVRPGYSLSGKAVRYDCIVPSGKTEEQPS